MANKRERHRKNWTTPDRGKKTRKRAELDCSVVQLFQNDEGQPMYGEDATMRGERVTLKNAFKSESSLSFKTH